MHIVETYDLTEAEYRDATGTRTWPACALLEDDDGFRWLISTTQPTDFHHQSALASGAQGILLAAEDGGWHSATMTRYAQLLDTGGEMLHSTAMPPLTALMAAEAAPAPARPVTGFVNLHTHSEYSPMDGASRIPELVQITVEHGAGALGITDHGTCAGHPELQIAAANAGVRPIFGIEAYLVDDIAERGKSNAYWHLVLLAQNDQGLKNLWAASTEAYRRGMYYKPRMDWDILARHSEGLIATTACLSGPIAKAILTDDPNAAAARLARLQQIFDGRLYAEIHTLPVADQYKVNKALVELAAANGVPLVAAADSHYPRREDHGHHQVWVAATTREDVGEIEMFQDGEYHLHTAEDMQAALSYMRPDHVRQALASTVEIAQSCDAEIRTRKVLPLYSPKSSFETDAAELRKAALAGWPKIAAQIAKDPAAEQVYRERFEREMDLLVKQRFCGYFRIVADYVNWAKDNGILVGPGRGSGGASLIAYLINITEIDPVRWDLPFERFLTPGRESLPDFDIDFPASKRGEIFDYLVRRWGFEHVVSIGTISRLKSKGVAKELERALRATLPPGSFQDMEELSQIITEAEAGTAGLGLSWEDLWAQHGEQLAPYRERYPALFNHADRLVGLLKTYSKHAAGAVISTGEPLTGAMPLRSGEKADDRMITQFDDDAVEMLGLIKYDILTLRTLDTIQEALKLIAQRYGLRINIYAFDNELDDPMVWEMLCSGDVLGCFQIETSLGGRWVRDIQPRTLGELADVTTLVRPGPLNSGLSHTYLARRRGEEEVTVPDGRLTTVLAPTYGTIIYQEQVLATCRIIAGHDDLEADNVRKILGKKKIDKVESAGKDFIYRAVERGMPHDDAAALWEQMAEFSRYAFGKAHAYAYALLCYWTAFLKIHYPVEFMAATLSTVKPERIPDFVKESRRIGVPVVGPDINISKTGFTPDRASIRYGISSLDGIGKKAADEIIAHQPYTSVEDLAERTGRAVTRGTIAILARAGALDTLEPHRAYLIAKLEAEASGASAKCRFKDEDLRGPDGEEVLPCRFDWASEPQQVNTRNGKLLPLKPPPKRCTKACRQYTEPAQISPEQIPAFTPAQIGEVERELFGMYLTYNPFDRVSDAMRAHQRGVVAAIAEGAQGARTVLAYVEEVKHCTAKNGLHYGRFVLDTDNGPQLTPSCFGAKWKRLSEQASTFKGQLVGAELVREGQYLNLNSIKIL